MFLATGSAFDFMQFLQIISWILIPALVIAVSVTVFFHYRKKRELTEEADRAEKLILGSPEIVGYTKGDGEFICFDHSPLISQYKNQLTYSHARFSALHHDFENLESRYQALAGYAITRFRHKSENIMGKSNEEMPKQIQQEIEQLSAQYKSEKNALLSKLVDLNQSFKSLEEENQFLQEQLNMQTATGREQDAIVAKWMEENKTLKDKVSEQQYLNDLLDEKKAQITFLQDKLEHRVRAQHESDQQCTVLESQLDEARIQQQLSSQLESNLKKELLHKQEEADKLQVVLCGKEEQLNIKTQQLAEKEEHIKRLETVIAEMREKENTLNTLINERQHKIDGLQFELEDEKEKNQLLSKKNLPGTPVMQNMHSGFASVASGGNQSPVISLNPAYLSSPDDEIAVH